jgi:hypothetical protein
MDAADLDAALAQLRLQFPQHDVGLTPDQHPHRFRSDTAQPAMTALRWPGCGPRPQLRQVGLRHPTIADIQPLRQLFQRPLAGRVRIQHLLAQSIAISASHILQALYLTGFGQLRSGVK